MRGEIIAESRFLYLFYDDHKTNKEASTVLFSVVKHLGSCRALNWKGGKTLDHVSCFPLHFFRTLPLPACFTTKQSTVEASLAVDNYIFTVCLTGPGTICIHAKEII